MIINEELAVLKVRRIIFHEVPRNVRGSSGAPTLADAETPIDKRRADMLRMRLIQVLGSKAAYPVVFDDGIGSTVPKEVADYTASTTSKHFVEMSQRLAQNLFAQQSGSISSGLLCVIDVVIGSLPGLAMMKLEREQGMELQWHVADGKRSVEMSVLDNLVLTDGTRLFKSVLFLRGSNGIFRSMACDSQRHGGTSTDVAQFWLRFLGCKFKEDPRVTTQRWFDTTVNFVNELVTDPIAKNDIYESLFAELKSNKSMFAPKKFVEEFIPKNHRVEYLEFAKENGLSLNSFHKDLTDITNKLRRRSFHTSKGVTVTAPADQEQLVDIKRDEIVVHDRLKSIANR